MNYSDKWLTCADCGRQFLWDAGEQAGYRGRNLANQPKHCKCCRDRRRDVRLQEPRQFSKVSCDRCGTSTFVPFVPLGTKPIYCRACMTKVTAVSVHA